MAFAGFAVASAAVANTAYTVYSGEKARKSQKTAANQARADALRNEKLADQAMNRANQKTPNIAALMKRNLDASSAGVGGTFLTGAGGAPVTSGMLGRSTQLGR